MSRRTEERPTAPSEARNDFRRLVAIAKPYRGLLSNIVAIMLFVSLLRLTFPLPMKFLIDSVFPNQDMSLLFVVIGALVLIHALQQVLVYINSYTMRYVANRVTFDLRRRVFRHLQRLSLSFYDQHRTGSILSRLMGDVSAIQQLITGQALSMASNVFTFFAILVILLCLNVKLALISLSVLPVHVLAMIYFQRRIKERNRRLRQKMAQIHGNATEVLTGAKLVKSFAAEMRESKSFVKETREAFNLNIHQGELSMAWSALANMLYVTARLLVIGFGGMEVMRNPEGFSPGTFLAFYSYTTMLHQPVMTFVHLLNSIFPALVGVERVFEVLDTAPDIQEAEHPVTLKRARGEVEFEDVCFRYDTGEEVLKKITMSVSPGEVVALVGPSGSGKSTIANLVARFYDVTSGRILIDGVDIRRLKLKPFREQIGTVLQETFLFSGTVEDNIRYGRPDASSQQVVEAARQANAHDFIMELEEGYQTPVGQNGVLLSGGQRQRIAIARAILRDPRLLILDEATSSLDTASEALIQEALDRLMQGRTTFVIAHRLSTIRNASKIFVIEHGRILQAGTHEELLKQRGLYRQLYAPDTTLTTEPANLKLANVA